MKMNDNRLILVVGLVLSFFYSINSTIVSSMTLAMVKDRYQYYCIEKLHQCSSHGKCLLEKCICDPGWTGEYCEMKGEEAIPPCVPLNCNYELADPTCDASIQGSCEYSYMCTQYPSDACHYHPEYGVLVVPYERWILAQRSELTLWLGNDGNEDRNTFHQYHFQNYKYLPTKHLGHVLEIASGPYTQLKTLLTVTGATVDSVTLLEPQMMEYKEKVPGCSYKNNTLLGHRVNFLVGRGEDFQLGEVYDTVIMINGIEHCQDSIAVLNNLYHAIKPGGYLIWHENNYETYVGNPYLLHDNLLDFIFHPIRIKRNFWNWYLHDHFEVIYRVSEQDFNSIEGEGVYFIGRKPLTDKGWDYLFYERP